MPGAFVGVPELSSTSGFAGTSTIASPMRPGAGEAKGVVVAEFVVPAMFARAPTPLQEAEERPLMEGATARRGKVGVPGVASVLLPTRFSATPDTLTPRDGCSGGTAAKGWGATTGTDAMSRNSGLRFCRSHRQD